LNASTWIGDAPGESPPLRPVFLLLGFGQEARVERVAVDLPQFFPGKTLLRQDSILPVQVGGEHGRVVGVEGTVEAGVEHPADGMHLPGAYQAEAVITP